MADEGTLRQVVFNLIHNSIKAINKGGAIKISSGKIPKKQLWLEITDDGPGIPADAVEDIFKPYFTLDPSGTGLGLAIVKQLVFNHNWKIQYLGEAGKGAIFRIEGIKLS